METELKKAQIEVLEKESGREAVDFINCILYNSMFTVFFILSIDIN
tara:strand:+ start:152904 stop:153041 length:138 start_codon:yes stop_codon:yes gene_type:complete